MESGNWHLEHLTGRWERTGILLEKVLTILGGTRVPRRHLGTVVGRVPA